MVFPGSLRASIQGSRFLSFFDLFPHWVILGTLCFTFLDLQVFRHLNCLGVYVPKCGDSGLFSVHVQNVMIAIWNY